MGIRKRKSTVGISGWPWRILFAASAICLSAGLAWYAYWFFADGFRTANWVPATATVSMSKVNLDGDGWPTGLAATLLRQYRVDFILHYTAQGVDVSHTARVSRFAWWRAQNLADSALADGARIAIRYDPSDPYMVTVVDPPNEPWFSYLFLCLMAMFFSVKLDKGTKKSV